MRIVVTGSSGRLGSWVVRELLEAGHEVAGADRLLPATEAAGVASFQQTDVTDVGQLCAAAAEGEAIIHLAAIPEPVGYPPEVVFRNNTSATFAVLQAASLMGIKKVVLASSMATIGMTYAVHPFPPRYVPIDEDHPLTPQDVYGLAKAIDERIGAMFHERNGVSVVALRYHWIGLPEEIVEKATMVSLDPSYWANALWGYLDIRDAARACRLAAEARTSGFHILNVAAPDTLSTVETQKLLSQFFPTTSIRAPIHGTTSPWATERALEVLGWRPGLSWREPTPVG